MSEKKGKNAKSKPVKEEIIKNTENKQEQIQDEVKDNTIESDDVLVKSNEKEKKEEIEIEETTPVDTVVADSAQEDSTDEAKADEKVQEKAEDSNEEKSEIEKAAVIVEESQHEEDKKVEIEEDASFSESVTVAQNIEELPTEGPKFVEIDESKVIEAEKEEKAEQAEEAKPMTEEPKVTDIEGELVPHEKDKQDTAKDKSDAKAGPSKFALFLKKYKLIFIIAAIVLVLAAAAVTTYFILTKDLVFVRSAEDIINADKGHTFVFKSDITIDNDITIEGYSFDLNGYTFTVEGALTINGTGTDTINIGDKKRKDYILGGVLQADSIIINGYNIALRSKTVADTITINTSNVELYGDIQPLNNPNATVSISNNATSALFYSALDGDLNLGSNVNLDFYGSASKISNGNIITAFDGAVATLIEDAQKAILYPESRIDNLRNVADFVFVEYLAAPELLIVKEGNLFVCYVSEVKNADHYDYSIDGQTGRIASTESNFVLPELSPGRYNLSVTAGSTNESYNSSRATTIIEVQYTVKLAKPVINVTITGETVNLVIAEVDNATEYVYSINGVEYAPVAAGTIDITDKVADIGKYTIYAYARNTIDNSYEQSNHAMTSYINSVQLVMSEITVVYNEEADNYTAEWTEVDNTNYYQIIDNGIVTYTRETSYTFTEGSITIVARGKGFYNDASPIVVNAVVD